MPRALPPAAGMKAEGECIRQSWALQPGVPCGIIKGMGRRNLVYRAMACLMYAAVALLTIEIFFALLSGRAFLWPEWALIALLMPLLVLSANAPLLGALQSAAARALFPALRRFWRFLALLLAVLLAVEAIQMALRCGSCDVDDVLLNLIGATTAYFAIRIPPVARWLRRRYYLWESGMAARAGAAAIHQ